MDVAFPNVPEPAAQSPGWGSPARPKGIVGDNRLRTSRKDVSRQGKPRHRWVGLLASNWQSGTCQTWPFLVNLVCSN